VSTKNPDVADPASEQPLLTQLTGPDGHDGGMLLFGPDGYLYFSFGDGDAHYPEPIASHQRIDRGFFGAVLRLDVDQKEGSLPPNPHPAVHPGTYAVPPDNPFVGAASFNGAAVAPARVRTEFWAVGLRNPWRLDFDPATGLLWCGDVGLHEREEIDVIVRGGNYGWDYREGGIAGPHGRAPDAAHFIEPVWEYDHSLGLSITGGFVYHGKNFPELEGKYLFSDYVLGTLWALAPDGAKSVGRDRVTQIGKVAGAVAFSRDADGEPLIASYTEDKIYRLARKTGAGAK
jgi:glucose/arabinose dehydrogenase